MRLEKTYRQCDGSRIKIIVSFIDYFNKFEWDEKVSICEKGGRKWKPLFEKYTYEGKSKDEKNLYLTNEYKRLGIYEDIISLKLDLWNSLKPN